MKPDEAGRREKERGVSVASRRVAMRILRVSFGVYLAGCVIAGIALIWLAVADGGLERQRRLREWLVIAALHGVYAALWPIWCVVLVLMYFRIIHGTI